jgi:hypothetical protein
LVQIDDDDQDGNQDDSGADNQTDGRTKGFRGKRKGRQCLNKLCQTETTDPNLWSKQKVKNSTICKACFDAFKSNQYCHFCYQIYFDNESNNNNANDDKDWIECEECKHWVILLNFWLTILESH